MRKDPFDRPLMRVDQGGAERPDAGLRVDSIYRMQLWGLIFPPIWFLAGLRAFRWRATVYNWQRSHYEFIIRGWYLGLAAWILGVLLSPLIIGVVLLVYWYVWAAIRAVQGRRMIDRGEGHPAPLTLSWHTALGDDEDF